MESLRPYKDNYIIKLREINSLTDAKRLAGEEIWIPEEDLQSLEKDHYYIYQIIGCSVVTKGGEEIGEVEDYFSIPENNLLVVRREKRKALIPFTKEICVQVNLEKKRIIIDPPEGLLELNEI